MRLFCPLLFMSMALSQVSICSAAVLWFNGDPASGGVSNERNTTSDYGTLIDRALYEDFLVTEAPWHVESFFSYSSSSLAAITGADWEIRSGVSSGNGGTLIASGFTATDYTWTPNWPNPNGGPTRLDVDIADLELVLPMGRYWLMVRPVGWGFGEPGRAWLNGTNGANAIGLPAGNNGNNFLWFKPPDDAYFRPAENPPGVVFDFSMGVEGHLVPEPISWWLLAAGLIALAGAHKLRPPTAG